MSSFEKSVNAGLGSHDWSMFHADEGGAGDAVEEALRLTLSVGLSEAAEGLASLASGRSGDWERGLEEACTFLLKLSEMAR